jgi:hypothetical protein
VFRSIARDALTASSASLSASSIDSVLRVSRFGFIAMPVGPALLAVHHGALNFVDFDKFRLAATVVTGLPKELPALHERMGLTL